MKNIISLLLVSTYIFTSCEKDEIVKENPKTVEGFWEGKFGNGDDEPDQYIAYLFRKDGSVKVYGDPDTTKTPFANGLYEVNGQNIGAKYIYNNGTIHSVYGMIDEKFTIIDGVWGIGDNVNDGGLFSVNKK